MTTFDFAPTLQANYQFTPTLDGSQYTALVNWNLFGQRYYLNVSDLEGNLVACLALVGSPDSVNLQALSWLRGRVTAVTAVPHGYPVGSSIELTVSGVTPDDYNGTYLCLVTAANQLQYDLADFPGASTGLGRVSYDIDLMGGYFASTLVFRSGSQQFEVSP